VGSDLSICFHYERQSDRSERVVWLTTSRIPSFQSSGTNWRLQPCKHRLFTEISSYIPEFANGAAMASCQRHWTVVVMSSSRQRHQKHCLDCRDKDPNGFSGTTHWTWPGAPRRPRLSTNSPRDGRCGQDDSCQFGVLRSPSTTAHSTTFPSGQTKQHESEVVCDAHKSAQFAQDFTMIPML
jgi:hypothetical protein